MANRETEISRILEDEGVKLPLKSSKEYEKEGYSIATHRPYFVLTENGRRQAREIAVRMKLGGGLDPFGETKHLRVIGWYGTPGTGKNVLAKEIAACLKMPYVEFDLGHGSDLLELIGGTGLRAENGATLTGITEGPLVQAARVGAMIAINEIVNVEGIQLSVLHDMIQGRKIMIPSAEAHVEIPIHQDTFFVFTWNPDIRNPDRQMPPPALLDRLRARRFEIGEEEEEEILRSYLAHVLGSHVSIEAVKQDVKLIRELRIEYEKGQLARCPYMRALQDFSLTRIYYNNKGIENQNAAAFRVLETLCDQDPQEYSRQREVLKLHFEPIYGQLDSGT